MSKRDPDTVDDLRPGRPKCFANELQIFGLTRFEQHERRGCRSERLIPLEALLREIHRMKLSEPQSVEVGLGALLVLGQVLEDPVGREDVGLAVLPQEVQLVEVFFDDVQENRRSIEGRHECAIS